MKETEKLTPLQTISVMTEIALPGQSNSLGHLLGGEIMHFMDIAGTISCRRYTGGEVATVAADKIQFLHPVKVGDIITITAKMIWTGHTSMKTHVDVVVKNKFNQIPEPAAAGDFTYVALDASGRPTEVPPLAPQTEEEKTIFDEEQRKYLENKDKV